jgi:hypothetical protein
MVNHKKKKKKRRRSKNCAINITIIYHISFFVTINTNLQKEAKKLIINMGNIKIN